MLDFIIIGAQKAATSALQGALRAAAGVAMPAGESPYFEDPEYQRRLWEGLRRAAPAGSVVGIKRPDILCSDVMRERILDSHPQVRLIAVLREPVGRAISAYYHLVRHAELPLQPLNRGLGRCLSDFERRRASLAAAVIENGLYGRHLQRWFRALPRERVLLLSQRQVATEPAAALQRALLHVGAPCAQDPVGCRRRDDISMSNVGIYDPRALRLARLASVIKTRPLPQSFRRVPRAAPLRAGGALLSRVAEQLALSGSREPEPLAAEIRAQLTRIYLEDGALLRSCVDPGLIDWDEPGVAQAPCAS